MTKAATAATKPAAQWKWKPGGPTPKVTADIFGAEVERIAGEDPLHLVDPDELWKSARKRTSPIHLCWNWNVQDAAEQHWRDHARHLITRLTPVVVEVTEGPTTSRRSWWSVKVDNRRGYMSEENILSSRDLTLQTIATVKAELHTFLAKFASVLTFGNIVPRLQEIIDQMQDEIDRIEGEATRRKQASQGSSQPLQPGL